eukprot:m.472474 g.472474  ORF g.472474 m.472474 type:complete len:156 (-) comp32783_c0_seq1:110-577(-)
MGLTPQQAELITSTWATAKELGAETVGVLLFKNIFTDAPAAKAIFPFSRSPDFDPAGDLTQNTRLVKHGVRVVGAVDKAIGLLGELDRLVPILEGLGRRHVGYGVADAHYDIVGAAFLKTLGMGLGDAFTDEVREAYTAMWEIVASTMKAGAKTA